MTTTNRTTTLGPVQVTLPEGFVEDTYYSFRDPSGDEHFTVDRTFEPEFKTPASAIADRKERIGAIAGASFVTDEPRTVSGHKAHLLIVDAPDGLRTAIAMIGLAPGRFLEIKYQAKPSVKQRMEHLEAFLARFVVDGPPVAGSPPGFVCYRTGVGAIEVPSKLTWNGICTFRRESDRMTLALSTGRTDRPGQGARLPSETTSALTRARCSALVDQELRVGSGGGHLLTYRLPAAGEDEDPEFVARFEGLFLFRIQVLLEVRGTEPTAVEAVAKQVASSATVVETAP